MDTRLRPDGFGVVHGRCVPYSCLDPHRIRGNVTDGDFFYFFIFSIVFLDNLFSIDVDIFLLFLCVRVWLKCRSRWRYSIDGSGAHFRGQSPELVSVVVGLLSAHHLVTYLIFMFRPPPFLILFALSDMERDCSRRCLEGALFVYVNVCPFDVVR